MRPPLVLLHAVLLCHARRHGAVVDEAPSSRELGGRPRPRPASNGFRRPPPRVVHGQDARKKEARKKNKAKQAKFDSKRRNDSDDDEYGADAVPKRRKLTLSLGKKR